MAKCATATECPAVEHRKPQKFQKDQKPCIVPDRDLLMKRILDSLRATPPGEVLKRLAALPDIRRGKVLNIRHQLAAGTYKVTGRLNRVIDRVLAIITG